MYDNNGDAFGFKYNGTEYFYVKNLQNDITAITDSAGKVIANYYYDAWGNITSTTGNTDIANANPLRYRSYYYDTDTKLYYLNTRYYSPDMSRFLNADGYIQTGQGVLDKNMFAYCGNSPSNRMDPTGTSWSSIKSFFSKAAKTVGNWFSNTFGAGTSVENHAIKEYEKVFYPINGIFTVKSGTGSITTTSKSGNISKPVSVYTKTRTDNLLLSSAGIKCNIKNSSLDISLGLDNIGITASYKQGNQTTTFGIKADLSQLKIGIEAATIVNGQNLSNITYTNVSVTGFFIVAAYYYVTTGQTIDWSIFAPSKTPAYN